MAHRMMHERIEKGTYATHSDPYRLNAMGDKQMCGAGIGGVVCASIIGEILTVG